MTSNLKNFLALASKNEELFTKLQELSEETDTEIVFAKTVAIAKEAGIELTMDDFEKPDSELSDDELASVAGGLDFCACMFCGSGAGSYAYNACDCIVGGSGYTSLGKGVRCICVSYGFGDQSQIL